MVSSQALWMPSLCMYFLQTLMCPWITHIMYEAFFFHVIPTGIHDVINDLSDEVFVFSLVSVAEELK